jgi:ribosomal protein L11 methylase PrmA
MREPPGRLIASGLLNEEADRVAGAFAAVGLRETERRSLGEWSALTVVRADRG